MCQWRMMLPDSVFVEDAAVVLDENRHDHPTGRGLEAG